MPASIDGRNKRIAFTRFSQDVLVQLIYTAWFPRRTATGVFDLVAGELDAVVFRITLDVDGSPLLADTIHACGCYHLFFPGRCRLDPASICAAGRRTG